MTHKDNFIVILKRIYEINGRRSMPSLPLSLTALYISSNNHHRGHHRAHRFPVQDSQTPQGNKASLTPISATVTSTTSHTRKEEEEEVEKERTWGGENTSGKPKPDREGWRKRWESEGEGERERLQAASRASSLEYSNQFWSWLAKHCSKSCSSSQLIRISAASFWGEGQDVGGLIAFYFPV